MAPTGNQVGTANVWDVQVTGPGVIDPDAIASDDRVSIPMEPEEALRGPMQAGPHREPDAD